MRLRRISHAFVALLSAITVGASCALNPAAGERQLSLISETQEIQSIAARLPEEPDRFVAALYYANSQLLVVRHQVCVAVQTARAAVLPMAPAMASRIAVTSPVSEQLWRNGQLRWCTHRGAPGRSHAR